MNLLHLICSIEELLVLSYQEAIFDTLALYQLGLVEEAAVLSQIMMSCYPDVQQAWL